MTQCHWLTQTVTSLLVLTESIHQDDVEVHDCEVHLQYIWGDDNQAIATRVNWSKYDAQNVQNHTIFDWKTKWIGIL